MKLHGTFIARPVNLQPIDKQKVSFVHKPRLYDLAV